jgi:hypothetical protein
MPSSTRLNFSRRPMVSPFVLRDFLPPRLM